MWEARLLLADYDGRWWDDERLNAWATDGRRQLNNRLLWDIRATDRPSVGGLVSLSGIPGTVYRVGGLEERPLAMMRPGWESDHGTPICWVRIGSNARLWPAPPDGDVVVSWLPDDPQLPDWANAGVALYVAARAYESYGPAMSIPDSQRYEAMWQQWTASLRDIDSQHLRMRRLRR